MCLGVPGEVLSISDGESFARTGRVSFGGAVKEVNLAFVPEVQPGDYVIVHAGFALSIINEAEAGRIFELLNEIGPLESKSSNGVVEYE